MVKYIDYLSGEVISKITSLSLARYAMKVANDNYFSIVHMREQMERELNRSAGEIRKQKLSVVEPFLPVRRDSTGEIIEYTFLPNPLPSGIPQEILSALDEIDEQFAMERARAEAELEADSAPLWEVYDTIIEVVLEWLQNEIDNKATWLGGNKAVISITGTPPNIKYARSVEWVGVKTITLSGCKITFNEGEEPTLEWTELNYDE